MNPSEPLLTVVIPTRNRKNMALEALRSVLESLPFSLEVILSDNASEDSTPELATFDPRITYRRRPQLLPMAEHWNLCVREAKGKYVKVLCDDDWLLPGALEREVTVLENEPGVAAVASARYEVSTQGKHIQGIKRFRKKKTRLDSDELFFQMVLGENIVGPPTSVTFRKTDFHSFPSIYQYAADWAAWILLAEMGSIVFLPDPGANFRLHASNLTLKFIEDGTDFLEVQALRRECKNRVRGWKRPLASLSFSWIYLYRLSRRLARYMLAGNLKGLRNFLHRWRKYQIADLPAI